MAPLTTFSLSLLTLLGLLSSGGTSTTFTMENKCEHTVWPGIFTSTSRPLATTGFALEKGEIKSLTAPEGWQGRFWGRTLCSNDSTGNFSCVTGDCGSGKLECSETGRVPPATLAEFWLDGFGGNDFYDVSLVDGFNLPMLVVPQGDSGNSSCPNTGCVADLNYVCPSELKVTSLNGSEGTVACMSACQAFNEPQYCCTGAYATRDKCQPTSYSKAFKNACLVALSYAYDNKNVFTCNTTDNYAIIFCPTPNTSLVWNKLHSGESLNKSSLMFSAGGDYSLGFKFNSSYLTLSFIPAGIPVWIANLDNPISDPSSALLTLDKNPILLQITHRGGNPIVLYSSPENLAEDMQLVATLSTSGNLVLEKGKKVAFEDPEEPSEVATEFRATSTPTRTVLWQSFDHPNAALRPGMKLGVDHLSRQNCSLWSVQSSTVRVWNDAWNQYSSMYSPAPGFFSLEWNAAWHQLEIKKSRVVHWSSGEFRNGTFDFIDIPPDSVVKYNFSVVSNEREDSFSYSASYLQESRKRSLWVLDTAGKLYDIPHNISIAKLDNCDGYNNKGGCRRWQSRSTDCPLQSSNDDFQLMQNGSFRPKDLVTSTSSSWLDSNQSRSGIDNCKATCWKDCNCLGFDFLSDNQTGCRYWSVKYSHFLFSEVGNESATSATSFVIPGLIQIKPSRRKIDKWIWIVTALAAVLLAVTLCIVIWFLLQRRKVAGENRRNIQDILEKMKNNRPTRANGIQTKGDVKHDISVFSYASIIAATRNFSDDNKLGQGGFGPVYKGKMVTGQEIAVKRLSKLSGQGALEFQNELILIYELQHKNLVQLFGFCIHGDERMLIYEYLPNKSLDYFLFDSTRGQQLDWKKRFSIIEGIAQGLLYLHKYSRMTVIHRDLKASNVLLDGNMNPKISDFGMSRIFAHEEQEAHTRRIVGTKGYMSPEYVMGGNFSMKSDVYSFGVLMLEIVSGRRNNSFYNDDRAFNLVDYAWTLRREGAELGLMDPTIGDSCIKEQLLRCIHVGLLCVEETAANRPTMLDAISMLTTENMSLPEPVKPAFCAERNVITAGIDGNQPEIPISVNGMSNSDLVGR